MRQYKGIRFMTAGDRTGLVFVRKIRWVGKNVNEGAECLLRDVSGEVIFHSVAEGKHVTDSFDLNRLVALYVEKLDAGELFLYE